MSLLVVDNLTKTFRNGQQVLKNISFHIERGDCLGLVGESGCGKSTLARCLLRIEPIDSGSIYIDGFAVERLKEKHMRTYRKKIQMVFQNPTAALNPKRKIKDSLLDGFVQFQELFEPRFFVQSSLEVMVNQWLDAVELPKSVADCYPHELSGGQRQRVTIARALSIEPDCIILDEPTSSLDVVSREAILRLLHDLREQFQIAYLFISHDLAVVYQMSQKIMVMKDGEIIDFFEREKLFDAERQDYTKELVGIF